MSIYGAHINDMIDPNKLFQLEGGQRRRKLALTFGALERDIAGIAEPGCEYRYSSMSRADYTKTLARIVLHDHALPTEARAELSALLDAAPFDERRVCNAARNHLLTILGTSPAEWDLVIAPHDRTISPDGNVTSNQEGDPSGADGKQSSPIAAPARAFFPNVCVYAEDIRSPFNLGSIFRTAEAMGADKVFLSPLCVDPASPRAVRSAMGCIDVMGWERRTLEELPDPVFVLETGGIPIDKFPFPNQGVCILGSEELGASPAALRRAAYGRVSIPMRGIKASLNVGVAFGILMQSWCEALARGAN